MSEMTIALVTGASKGLGRETVRRFAGMGWRVFLSARDTRRGTAAVRELTQEGLEVDFVRLDVTDDESVQAAADIVKTRAGRLDVLVNNAGIGDSGAPPNETSVDELCRVFETNVFGVVRVTNAFLPLLREAEHPRIVMVSSGLGSVATVSDPALAGLAPPSLGYAASKAALNMITSRYASAFPEVRTNAVDPGFTATDLNDHSGVQTVTEGTDAIIRLADVAPEGPTGGFFNRNGPTPW